MQLSPLHQQLQKRKKQPVEDKLILQNFQKKGAQKAPFFYLLHLLPILLIVSSSLISCQFIEKTPDIKLNTVTVKQVIDGDSIELTTGEKIRYKGINAPERNQHLYQEATDLNRSLVLGKEIRIEYDEEKKDQYGRSLGYVFVGKVLVNQEMIRNGLAFLYEHSKTGSYQSLFLESMEYANNHQLGLWKQSNFPISINKINANAPGNDEENVNGEWLEINNQGKETLSLDSYYLKDESNNLFTFPAIFLKGNGTLRIYSGKGKNTNKEIFWQSDRPIWNNDSDCAYLFDNQSLMVDCLKYP